MTSPLEDVAAFDAAWRARWPACRPIGHDLRSQARETWVRFQSLPGSKRHAENDAEHLLRDWHADWLPGNPQGL